MSDGYICTDCFVYIDWCEGYSYYHGAYVCPICDRCFDRLEWAEDYGLSEAELEFNFRMYEGDFSGK